MGNREEEMNTEEKRSPTKILLVAVGLLASLVISACGGSVGGASNENVTTVSKGDAKASGTLVISNWPLYIDSKTVSNFERDTGVNVKYIEDYNDNVSFFGKLRPQLEQGQSGGRSIIVPTDWMAARMDNLGYLEHFSVTDDLPNVDKNLREDLKSPSYDPNREFSVPWQSGMTGLIVRKDLAPDVRSINDLFDPKYKGKVTMLTELRDTVPLVMKADGIDPDNATKEDWLKTIDKIKSAAASGQIRDFTGNDYAGPMVRGDVVAAIGWSGDAVQLQADNPNIEYRMPTQGCILWSDNMVIPVGAPNPNAALEWINYVYRPDVAADIAEYVNYITPVDGAKEVLAKRDPKLAENPLIFPTASYTSKCSNQPSLEGSDEQQIEDAFEQAITG